MRLRCFNRTSYRSARKPLITMALRYSASTSSSQNRVPASYYRGGTSRALFFSPQHLPKEQSEWAKIFRQALGSPDPNGRQLDGMGGGISSLSKICIVGPSERNNADVDFTFAAVGVKNDEVDFSSNCGNMISAVGPYAVDAGLVPVKSEEDEVTIRIYNTNSGKIVHAKFPVANGEACAYGSFALDGVAGTGAKIRLDFLDPAGGKTGRLLPTGNKIDTLEGKLATCIDVGNPSVFVNAADFNVSGSINPSDAEAHPVLLTELEKVRRVAAVKMGISDSIQSVPGSIPKICMVDTSQSHDFPSGIRQEADEIDVTVRAISVGQPHRAIPITVALATAAASKIEGSVVHSKTRAATVDPSGITLGHAGGKILVNAAFDETHDMAIRSATVFRTARRLMEGFVYWK